MVQAVEVDRKVHRDRHLFIDGGKYQAGTGPAGTTVTMRLDGHLMHAIADGALAGTWPCPSPPSAPRGWSAPAPPQRRCPRRGEHRRPFAQAGRADLAGTHRRYCFGR